MLRLLRSSGMPPPAAAAASAAASAAAASAAGSSCRRLMNTAILPSVDSWIPPPLPAAAPPLLQPPLSDRERAILQDRLGYTFIRPEFLEDALTHPSYPNRDPGLLYESLKKIGERNLIQNLKIYSFAPYQYVTDLNISPNKLARTAIRLGLYDFFRHDSPKLNQEVKEFTKLQLGTIRYCGIPSKAPTVLADLVHTMIGAICVDFNFRERDAWEKTMMHLEPLFFFEAAQHRHTVIELECICHDYHLSLDFKSKREDTVYTTQVFINGILHGSGSSEAEYEAKGIATLHAFNNLPMYMLSGTTADTPFKMKHKLRSLSKP